MNKPKNKRFPWIPVVAIGSFLLICGLWIFTYCSLLDIDPQVRGTFGDMFGGVNALFSGLALTGIIVTILIQSKELALQRNELQETRDVFKAQNSTLSIQRFENTFFNMLDMHHKIVGDIDFRYYKNKEKRGGSIRAALSEPSEEKEIVVITGRDVFRHRYRNFADEVSRSPEKWMELYTNHFEKAQTDFGHYFRNLYRTIKLVDSSDLLSWKNSNSEEQDFAIRYQYTSMIRAQLSSYELAWLFYNCLSPNGNEKFKPLIEKYALLKNGPDKLLLDLENHKQLYHSKAYGLSASTS